jgi:hypothetical protein
MDSGKWRPELDTAQMKFMRKVAIPSSMKKE